jgi:hypothetical protein
MEQTKTQPKASEPMPPHVLAGLNRSIAHWDRHAKGKAGPDEGTRSDDCALCHIFVFGENRSCEGCPVAAETGLHDCDGSPWADADAEFSGDAQVQTKAFRVAAAKMRDFLKSLLPETKNKGTK